MVHITNPGNGQIAAAAAAEIIQFPCYELISGDGSPMGLDRANRIIHSVFSRFIDGLHRRVDIERTSMELLLKSSRVTNQTYEAQVRVFVIFRMLGTLAEQQSITEKLSDLLGSFVNELKGQNFQVSLFEDSADYESFITSLDSVDCSSVMAVARKEKLMSATMVPGGMIYYNPVPTPSDCENLIALTNALTKYPDSMVSMQIIPTQYTQNEILAVEQLKAIINQYTVSVRMQTGPRLDATLDQLRYAYEHYSAAAQNPSFYYNYIVCSGKGGAPFLGSKLIGIMEADDRPGESAFEMVDITGCLPSLSAGFSVSPWLHSNALIYQAREQAFWGQQGAHSPLQRFRYLMTGVELRSVFKPPYDDGTAIGLDIRRSLANKERLHANILTEGSFKMGTISDASLAGGKEAHAGVPLNDFTKHGLIVGMSGSGKTWFSLNTLLQFWQDFHIPFLIIEPTKNEYRSMLDAIPDLQVFTPGKSQISPYIINPFIPPKNVTVESYAPSLMTAFKAAFTMPSPLPNVFTKAINEAYTQYGWKKRSTSDDPDAKPFGMYEFIRVFKREAENLGYQGESKANIESAGLLRLVSLIEQNSTIYDSINTIPLDELLSRPTVIELNAINDKEQKCLIMAFLLILICAHTKNNMMGDGKLKNILLIDEAHVLLDAGAAGGGEANPRATTIEAMEDMIAEVRSFGLGIIIADQNPTKVGRNIVANTNVKVMFKLVETENRTAVSTTTNMSSADYEGLARLGVGEAMLHFGRLNSPLHIKTYNLSERYSIRDIVPDEDVAKLAQFWKDPEHAKLLIPHKECVCNPYCTGCCDMELRDDAEYLAARLAQEHMHKIRKKEELTPFLARMTPLLRDLIAQFPSMQESARLINCAKIKFMRKAALDLPFPLSDRELEMILKHPKFIPQEEGGDNT